MIAHSSKEVRTAVNSRGYNEVDEVDRPQPGGAGCGHYFYPTCVDAVLSGHDRRPTLRRDRAFEINRRRKKFQRLLTGTREGEFALARYSGGIGFSEDDGQ